MALPKAAAAAAPAAAAARTMLVYGATGRSGLLVVERALALGWSVAAFVRDPARLPSPLRSHPSVSVITGDLCDAAAVTAAVTAARPHAVIDASSALPFGQPKGRPKNTADRDISLKATVAALDAAGRLPDCVVLVVGGQLIPEPGGEISSFGVAAMAWGLRLVVGKPWRELQAGVDWLFQGTPPALRFVYMRMGYMAEEPSRGTLRVEPTPNNIQRGKASYCDVADAFVRLAGDSAQWERKAVFFNYHAAAAPQAGAKA